MIQDSLGFLLAAATRLATKEFNKVLRNYHITAPQWSVLSFLCETDGCPQTEIAETLYWDKATIGDIVENLLKQDLVKRTVSEKDRRAYRVTATEKGRRFYREIRPEEAAINGRTCRSMTPDQQQLLHTLLHEAIKSLE